MARRRLGLIAAILLMASHPGVAADLDSGAMALLSDLGRSVVATPGTAEAAALDRLRAAGLLPDRRPTGPPPRPIGPLAQTLMMGNRGPQFAAEMMAVRDAVRRGDRDASDAALAALWQKAGRTPPDAATADAVREAVRKLDGGAPLPTVSTRLDRPDALIEIEDRKNAGEFSVAVTLRENGKAGATVLFRGEATDKLSADKSGLESGLGKVISCRVVADPPDLVRKSLNGKWRDRIGGKSFEIAGEGERITISQVRVGKPPLVFDGTYGAGRVRAFHRFVAPDDMENDLPASVKAQLIGWRTPLGYTIAFSTCDGEAPLVASWRSSNVTYDGMTETVDRVHDPYDVRMVLVRGERRIAQTGQFPAQGP